jgi:hypothetical protein
MIYTILRKQRMARYGYVEGTYAFNPLKTKRICLYKDSARTAL